MAEKTFTQQLAAFNGVSIVVCLLFTAFCTLFTTCSGHGRLIEPPSRASAWRYGFQTPPDYNDHELYCGGFTRQWKGNDGKCGECGDAWNMPEPRPHEYGGKWGQGVIVRRYNPGSEMVIRVELTASHMGYFEFRLCPEPKAKQDCLDKNLLTVLGGSPAMPIPEDLTTRFYPRNGSRIYEIKAQLPDMKCNHCVLQWRYIAGNNWGMCDNGVGAVGCGPQEEFRACSDIAIGEGGKTTMRPFRPTIKTKTTTAATQPPSTEENQTQATTKDEQPLPEEVSPYLAIFIAAITLLFVLCILASIYLYHYHGQRVKQLLRWKNAKDDKSGKGVTNMQEAVREASDLKCSTLAMPPIPPPRTKRLSQSKVKEFSADQSSVA
ncbi:uncharacterized protein LOC129915123 [Episyrphus balteatus]|uniref:uncharacterized protein LOC129915123 n=1 Tax=Episyrphus balteatus TaxID=286459 RepID=UPI0024851429|nr:uncharacterized protein LOC129915123 [Episyrphus balteatus]